MASLTKRNGSWTATARLPDTFKGQAKSRSYSQTFPYKKAAQLWLDQTESAMRLGTWVDPRLEVRTFGPLGWPDRKFKEALDAYRLKVTPTKKGEAQESAMLVMLAREDFADLRVRDVTTNVIASYRDARQEDGKSESTVRNNLNTVSAVFEWLIHDEEATTVVNPIVSLRRRKIGVPQPSSTGRERRLFPGEQERLEAAIAAIEGPTGRQWAALFPLLLDTGMRLGEAMSIRCGWLRETYGFVVIPESNSKNNAKRYVAISDAAFRAMLDLSDGESDDSKLFRFSQWTAENTWRYTIRVNAKADGLNIHDLRHEALSRMAARGADLKTMMRQSGHKTVAVLMRYLNPTPEEQRARIFPGSSSSATADVPAS